MDWPTDRAVLTEFVPPATFEPLRTMSGPPTARFLTMSWREAGSGREPCGGLRCSAPTAWSKEMKDRE